MRILKCMRWHRAGVLLCSSLVIGTTLTTTVKAAPIAMESYSFYVHGDAPVSGGESTVKITAKAKDGTIFEEKIVFGRGFGPDAVRDSVRMALQSQDWKVENLGMTGISITGVNQE